MINARPLFLGRRSDKYIILIPLDSNGNVVLKYKYDAWGNHAVLNPDGSENENSTFIGNVNPFRYRGYYYDTETGLYYLKSRYYDPETGRFITIDDVSYLAPDTINGLNLYAYCGKNPVMNVDPNGTFIVSLLLTIVVGSVLAASSSILVQWATTGTVNWAQVGISALFGAVAGALSFIGIGGFAGQFLIQGSLAVMETISLAAVDGTLSQLRFDQLFWTFMFSGVIGGIGGRGAAKEFKRVSQMEKSLIDSLKRGYGKNGISGLKQMWTNKSTKYVREFVKPLFRSSITSTTISTIINIASYWLQKLYKKLS